MEKEKVTPGILSLPLTQNQIEKMAALNAGEITEDVIVIVGGIGQGKTIYMSYLAKKIAKKTGAKLYSNYALRGSEEIRHTTESAVIAVDEAQRYKQSFNHVTNKLIMLTAFNRNYVSIPKDALIIEVQKIGDCIYSSLGDVIKISEYQNLYDAFLPVTSDFLEL